MRISKLICQLHDSILEQQALIEKLKLHDLDNNINVVVTVDDGGIANPQLVESFAFNIDPSDDGSLEVVLTYQKDRNR